MDHFLVKLNLILTEYITFISFDRDMTFFYSFIYSPSCDPIFNAMNENITIQNFLYWIDPLTITTDLISC